MCVYNGCRVSLAEFIRLKQMEKALTALEDFDLPVRQSYDYRDWPIIKPAMDKQSFDVVKAHWEFLPPVITSGEAHMAYRDEYDALNARGETLLSSTLYRDAALKSRCLVLSTHFFEYQHVKKFGKSGRELKAKRKIPYMVTVPGQELFFMAGVSQRTFDLESGESGETFAIVTTEANELMAQVHNSRRRMPTILPEDLAYEWLFGDLSMRRITELATYQFPAKRMKAVTVAKDFYKTLDPTASFIHENVPELIL